MKIYTKTGDTGETALFGGGRVGKDDERVDAYGQVDELNAVLGLARADGLGDMDALVEKLQAQLFAVGAVLATPKDAKAAKVIAPIDVEWVTSMERSIDALDAELPALSSFILPGGTRAAALLHLARTVCRRAERRVTTLVRAGEVDTHVVMYLNRLSDLLFTMARAANARADHRDVAWVAPRP
jgi:cob(I)alamin adenosyltransferase